MRSANSSSASTAPPGPRKQELDDYLKRLEEAKKRDHRDLGPRLGLFTILPDTIGPGLIFWLPKGATLRRLIEEYLRELLQKNDYQFVVTPHVARVDLWKTSGHWDFYQEYMFSPMKIEDQDYLLKAHELPGPYPDLQERAAFLPGAARPHHGDGHRLPVREKRRDARPPARARVSRRTTRISSAGPTRSRRKWKTSSTSRSRS